MSFTLEPVPGRRWMEEGLCSGEPEAPPGPGEPSCSNSCLTLLSIRGQTGAEPGSESVLPGTTQAHLTHLPRPRPGEDTCVCLVLVVRRSS